MWLPGTDGSVASTSRGHVDSRRVYHLVKGGNINVHHWRPGRRWCWWFRMDYHGHTSSVNNNSPAQPQPLPLTSSLPTSVVAVNYSIAKNAPFQNLNVHTLSSSFGALDFLPVLTTFLRLHIPICNISPSQYDCFNTFWQLNVRLLPNCYLNDSPWTSRICTTPAVEAKGRTPAKPPHFDAALVFVCTEGSVGLKVSITGLTTGINLKLQFPGLCVAQIRVIFELPPQFGSYLHPLAYLEWFTSLGNPDPLTGMHIVTHSTRQSCRNAAIVPVTQIVMGKGLGNPWGTRVRVRRVRVRVQILRPLSNPYPSRGVRGF